jgi:hypothetical protein
MKLYVDGVKVAEEDFSDSPDNLTTIFTQNSRQVEIGSYEAGGGVWKGHVADARIYNAVLSATEMATLAENILPNRARTTNLISHWKLDTAAGTSSVAAANSGTGGNAGTVTNSVAAPWVGNRTNALAGLRTLETFHGSGTVSLPALTTPRILCWDGGITQATGDISITEEMEIAGSTTFNANGNTISYRALDINGILDLTDSTVKSINAGSDYIDFTGGTLLSVNSTIEGYGTGANRTEFTAPAGDDIELVGTAKWLDCAANADLTVIGAVIDCDMSATGANIRQWHHTLDTQQLLDADENGDDDLRLTKPALDNSHELMTG